MKLKIDLDREADGRWIAQVRALRGVVVYAESREAAIDKAEVLAFRVLADRIEQRENPGVPVARWFRIDEADAEDAALGQAQIALADEVLEPEDFSDWPGYAEAVAIAEERRCARSKTR